MVLLAIPHAVGFAHVTASYNYCARIVFCSGVVVDYGCDAHKLALVIFVFYFKFCVPPKSS